MAAALKAKARPKTIIINKIDVELLVDLDDPSHKLMSKDSAFLQKIKKACDQVSDAAVDDMEKLIRRADAQAKGFDQQLAGLFLRPITIEMEHRYDKACKNLEKEAAKLLDEYRKAHDALKKSAFRVNLDGDFQGPTIQFDKKAVGTGGAKLAPVHMFGMLKESTADMRDCYNLSAAVSNVGLLIKRELTALQESLKNKLKTDKGAKLEGDETAKKCQAHIVQFLDNFKKMEKHWSEVAEKIEGAGHAEKDWEKKFHSTKSKLLADKANRIETTLKKANVEIGAMLRSSARITTEMKTLETSLPKFEKALISLMEGNAEWPKDVSAALLVNIEIHKEIKAADEVIKRGLQMVKLAEESIGKETKA